jgi:hypothetical protein
MGARKGLPSGADRRGDQGGPQYPTVSNYQPTFTATRAPLQRSQTLDRDLESPTMNCHREPTLNGILSDPIVRAVMEADGVNPLELEGMLREVAQRLRVPSGQHQAGLTRQF